MGPCINPAIARSDTQMIPFSNHAPLSDDDRVDELAKTQDEPIFSSMQTISALSNALVFKHQPLDHTNGSTRFLRILPDLSETGLVQCQIWSGTVNATYTCLSYVWGTEEGRQEMLINGKRFHVRKNLGNFMRVARLKYGNLQTTFWIDALCIDQTSIAERNHQVAQMGSIYSNATRVIAWLGHTPVMEYFLRFCLDLFQSNPQGVTGGKELWQRQERSQNYLYRGWQRFCYNPYWYRAWITQEVLLARKFVCLVNNLEVDAGWVVAAILHSPDFTKMVGIVSSTSKRQLFDTYLKALSMESKSPKKTLIRLLQDLPGRDCQIPRDRIYSLISVASDADHFQVDYGSSDDKLLSQLLRMVEEPLCLCLLVSLARNLGLQLVSGLATTVAQGQPFLKLSTSVTTPGPRSEHGCCDSCYKSNELSLGTISSKPTAFAAEQSDYVSGASDPYVRYIFRRGGIASIPSTSRRALSSVEAHGTSLLKCEVWYSLDGVMRRLLRGHPLVAGFTYLIISFGDSSQITKLL